MPIAGLSRVGLIGVHHLQAGRAGGEVIEDQGQGIVAEPARHRRSPTTASSTVRGASS